MRARLVVAGAVFGLVTTLGTAATSQEAWQPPRSDRAGWCYSLSPGPTGGYWRYCTEIENRIGRIASDAVEARAIRERESFDW